MAVYRSDREDNMIPNEARLSSPHSISQTSACKKGELQCGILLFTFIRCTLPKVNTMDDLRSQRFPAREDADQSLLLLLERA